ncbi:MAG: SPOR domain-containing protein [Candidatus Marinimicrobia bacterium]|nr:SPOR domain-containing protein [Candidatus Neomarinimicrobiota bacterium]
MKTKHPKIYLLLILIFVLTSFSFSNEVDEVLKGKNSIALRMSIKNMPDNIQRKVIKAILEENGENTLSQAKQIIMNSSDSTISAYVKIVIADHYLIDNNIINAQIQLDKAVEFDPKITKTKYFKLIKSRISGSLYKTDPNTNPKKISIFNFDNDLIQEKTNDNEAIKKPFHIQVGAFSELENSRQLAQFYLKNGYYVKIVKKQTSNRILYLVRIGEYETFSEANQSLNRINSEFQTTGLIIKDKK